jgi:hypothetical protein
MNVLSKVYTAPLQRPRGSTDEEEEVRATTEATETQTQTEPGPSRRTPITPAEKSVLTFTSRDSLMRRPACMFTLFLVSVGENPIQTVSSARPSNAR